MVRKNVIEIGKAALIFDFQPSKVKLLLFYHWNSIKALILDGDDIKDANFQEVSFWLAVIFTANMILFIFFYFCYSLPRKNRTISETNPPFDGKEIQNEDEYCEL